MADLKTLMEDIARAIRLKTGNSDKINAQDFPQKIREIGDNSNTSVSLNIAYGETPPEDTSKLWVKCDEPDNIIFGIQNISTEDSQYTFLSNYNYPTTEMGYCCVGNIIYILGGSRWQSGAYNYIYTYNINTKELTKLDNTLSVSLGAFEPIYYKGHIYIFGGRVDGSNTGSNVILDLDTNTNQCITLNAKLPSSLFYRSVIRVNNYAYIFAGRNPDEYGTSTMYRFNLDTKETDTSYLNLPEQGLEYGIATLEENGVNNIYIYGGVSYGTLKYAVYKIIIDNDNFSNSTIVKLSDSGASPIGTTCYRRSIVKNNELYVFSTKYNAIYKYNKMANIFEEFYHFDNLISDNNHAFIVDNLDPTKFYLITNSIYSLTDAVTTLEKGKLNINNNGFNALNLIEGKNIIRINNIGDVYLGNENNIPIKQEAYLYQNDTWVQI